MGKPRITEYSGWPRVSTPLLLLLIQPSRPEETLSVHPPSNFILSAFPFPSSCDSLSRSLSDPGFSYPSSLDESLTDCKSGHIILHTTSAL